MGLKPIWHNFLTINIQVGFSSVHWWDKLRCIRSLSYKQDPLVLMTFSIWYHRRVGLARLIWSMKVLLRIRKISSYKKVLTKVSYFSRVLHKDRLKRKKQFLQCTMHI